MGIHVVTIDHVNYSADRSWLRALRPDDQNILAGAASRPELVAELSEMIGEGAVGWAVERSETLFERVGWTAPFGDYRMARSVPEAIVLSAVLCLCTGRPVTETLLSEATNAIRHAVPRGLSVEQIMQGLQRTVNNLTAELFAFADRTLPSNRITPAGRQAVSDLLAWLDSLTEILVENFSAERQRWLESAAYVRRDLVESVLDGTIDREPSLERLGYDLSQQHVALILWASDGSEQDPQLLERSAVQLLDQAGCTARLLVFVGPAKLWAWGSRARQAPRRPQAAPDVTDFRVAAGLPAGGIAGFRESHRQAALAERMSRLLPRERRLFDFADLDLPLLMSDDLSRARDFVLRHLGPLSSPDDASAELRSTVQAYLEHARGVGAAAEQLHVAKNTVLYRVRKAEQLLDRSLKEDHLRLQVALHLAETIGAPVLASAEAR
ncbi:helix-turn-helix domain-containing protein [Amycolatopsis sp. NPDC048633]|uniref:PucR family transcriptional regulator n=1 Tax=Amycolatopsis sp. NPDC048633 TaxID=3157095 RepID=UPI0033FE2C10